MAPPKKEKITDPAKLACFRKNLEAMQPRLWNKPLYAFRRALREKEELLERLERENRPAFNALPLLPGYSTLQKYQSGAEAPTQEAVEKIAAFCSEAFAFEEEIGYRDLLERDLYPIPAMRPTQKLERYEGTFRCFYFDPDLKLNESGGVPRMRGGVLRLWLRQGELRACLLTGLRRDDQFPALERLAGQAEEKGFYAAFQAYNARLTSTESRLVCYRGTADTTVRGYLAFRLGRQDEEEHNNVAFLFLRRFDKSAQPGYTGGIANVTLCRGGNTAAFPMIVVREKLTMGEDGAFHARHLQEQSNGGRGVRISREGEEDWNRAMLERIGQRR